MAHIPFETKKLSLKIHGRILDHFGIQSYHTPTAALSELISNAWDADATFVKITLPETNDENSEIIIEDDGFGMTFSDCDHRYLNIGYDRRCGDPKATSTNGRPILGRKGIGKFAGFGIAQKIHVETISGKNGESTIFELDINQLRRDEYISEKPRDISATYMTPDPNRKSKHGTKIILKSLKLSRQFRNDFNTNLSKKFLFHKDTDNFRIYVNNEILDTGNMEEEIEYEFPKDFEANEKYKINDDGWGIVTLDGNHEIKWKVSFTRKPIKAKGLAGMTIYAHGKLAQKPFFFNISGGLGGQSGQPYMFGKIKADYIDQFDTDLISPERQRINWNMDETQSLSAWGEKLVKKLLITWHDKRGENRRKTLLNRVGGFKDRLDKLGSSERKMANNVLKKVGSVVDGEDDYSDICQSILLAIEQGRLKSLWDDINKSDMLNNSTFLELLSEAGVIAALNMAESVKTNLITIANLKKHIREESKETTLRDYVADHPQLLGPEWELFAKERTLKNIISDIGTKTFDDNMYNGRLDLILKKDRELLIVEFMRPGLTINREHITRCKKYVTDISVIVDQDPNYDKISALIIAKLETNPTAVINKELELAKMQEITFYTWDTILENALSKWREYLEILAKRGKSDDRLEMLLKD